jgi:cytochrome c553
MKKIIVIAAIAASMVFTGCGAEEAKNDSTKVEQNIVEQSVQETSPTVAEKTKSTWEKVKEKAKETAKKTKETTIKIVESTKQKAKEFDQEHNITEKAKAAVTVVKEKAHEIDEKYHVSEKTKEVVTVVKEKTKEVVAKATTPNAETLYKKCAGCHGTNAEKAALGKSQIIQGWDATKVSETLHGYKDGSYGGPMKGVMAGQAKNLSDEDISVLAEYISQMK